MQENYLPVTNTYHQNDPLYSLGGKETVFEMIDLGAPVVTQDVLDRVAFEQRLESYLPVIDRKSTRLNSSHIQKSRMPSSA